MTINTTIIQTHHSVFQRLEDGRYLVVKDILNHVSEGAILSGPMFNSYRCIIPQSVRLAVVDESGELTL